MKRLLETTALIGAIAFVPIVLSAICMPSYRPFPSEASRSQGMVSSHASSLSAGQQYISIYLAKVSPGTQDDPCGPTYAVERVVSTKAPVHEAVLSLLGAPSIEEQSEGYRSAIPQGTELISLNVNAGVAHAIFSHSLENGVTSPCIITTQRAQITNTLRQFSSVRDIVIAEEGR